MFYFISVNKIYIDYYLMHMQAIQPAGVAYANAKAYHFRVFHSSSMKSVDHLV